MDERSQHEDDTTPELEHIERDTGTTEANKAGGKAGRADAPANPLDDVRPEVPTDVNDRGIDRAP